MTVKYYSASVRGFAEGRPDSIEISIEYYQSLLIDNQNGATIEPDENGYPVAVFLPAPTSVQLLENAKQGAYLRIETDRNNAIVRSITSNALGSPHTYSTKPENRQFLNDLITLGNGGKFTCTDADDVKARLLHTHAQLMALGNDIEAHISAQFDHYELKLPEIAAVTNLPAPTQADFDAIVW